MQNAISDEHIRKIKKEMNEQQKNARLNIDGRTRSPMRNLTIRNSDFTPIKGKTNFSMKTNESIQRAVLSQKREEKERSARLAALDKRLAESPGVLASTDNLKIKAKNENLLYKKL